jgi:CPA1 family monovalent cation:H+ antiporter
VKLWHIAALVILGLIVEAIVPGIWAEPFRHLTLEIFLPALIFEAAWHLDPRIMLKRWVPIVMLAVPGVAVTCALVGLFVSQFAGLDQATGLLLGAILSATDPVAVVAIFKILPVPKDLAIIVESESLLNDAIAVILYRAAIVGVISGISTATMAPLLLPSLLGIAAALAIGIAAGLLACLLMRPRVNGMLQSVATFAAAYAAFYACERFHWSGIFAVIACALVAREGDRRSGASAVAEMVDRIWTRAAEIANAILFFLIGTVVELPILPREWRPIVVAVVAVILARALIAYGLLSLDRRLLRSWRTVVGLAGVRGALALALAIALPAAVHTRQTVIDVTFVVVVLWVVIGAVTLERGIGSLELE